MSVIYDLNTFSGNAPRKDALPPLKTAQGGAIPVKVVGTGIEAEKVSALSISILLPTAPEPVVLTFAQGVDYPNDWQCWLPVALSANAGIFPYELTGVYEGKKVFFGSGKYVVKEGFSLAEKTIAPGTYIPAGTTADGKQAYRLVSVEDEEETGGVTLALSSELYTFTGGKYVAVATSDETETAE